MITDSGTPVRDDEPSRGRVQMAPNPVTSPQRIRVLHIVLHLGQGGLERVVADLAANVDPREFDTHVLALEYLGKCAADLERTRLHLARRMSPLSMIWPRTLEKQVRAINPDIVHTHSGVWYKGSLAARLAGVETVIHTDHGRQNPDPWRARMLDRLASRRTDLVIAVSEDLQARLQREVVSVGTPVDVILNGVNTRIYRPQTRNDRLRAALEIPPETPLIGSVGRLYRVKGYDIMIEALARLHRRWPQARGRPPELAIVGDGPEGPSLRNQARTSGVERAVHFLGWRSDVSDLHASWDLFTLASRSEGTSISLLEAMATGLCPVVTAVGGNPKVLGPSLAHRLCEPEDPSSLANAWGDALEDLATARSEGVTARQIVMDRFSLQAMVEKYERTYEKLRNRG